MPERLPPLNNLRVFESAARHLSFTKAADELSVTQGAVSQQIKLLEESLGIKLFHRRNRQLFLTEEGQAYLPSIQGALTQIMEATRKLKRTDASGVLTVSVLPSFGARWLVPRLGKFVARHPEIDLRLSTTQKLVDFFRDDIDVGIRFGKGDYPGLHVTRLLGDELYPVCAPQLFKEGDRPQTPQDLYQFPLIQDHGGVNWNAWFEAAGVQGYIDQKKGTDFYDSGLALHAAVAGQGIALGRKVLAEPEIEAGRLIRLFDVSLCDSWAYYFVCPEANAQRAKVIALRDWLLEEVSADA